MLVIRQEQINTMVKGTEEEFLVYVINKIKTERPETAEGRDDETFRTMIRGGIRRAESHGFEIAEDIIDFVSAMFEVSPNFDEEEEIQRILDNENLTPRARLEFLWSDAVPAEVWENAEEHKNEDAWFDDRFVGESNVEEVESKDS